jgi:hypothetical protein
LRVEPPGGATGFENSRSIARHYVGVAAPRLDQIYYYDPGFASRAKSEPPLRGSFVASPTANAVLQTCRPYGTRKLIELYPALKRWANLFRAYGAGLLIHKSAHTHIHHDAQRQKDEQYRGPPVTH